MKNSLKLFFNQKKQYIDNLFTAQVNPRYRGFPVIDKTKCNSCGLCQQICPLQAINSDLQLDLGKCQFCNDCVVNCPQHAVKFTNFLHTAADSREKLLCPAGLTPELYETKAIEVRREITRIFGRSLKIRSVSAGGCNGCELELNAVNNVNFDLGRFGIDIVASPRHADVLMLSGPVSENMAFALETTYNAMPEPKLIILLGSCAISGGVFADSAAINRQFINKYKIDLFIPGCPPHPLTIANGLLRLINRKK